MAIPLVVGERIAARLTIALAIFLVAIVFLNISALAADAAMAPQGVKSEKGVTAWLIEDHTVPIITIKFVFGGGTTQDPVGKEGLAKMMADLLDEGAGDLDSDAFQIKLDEAGAEIGFGAKRDGIYGSMRMLSGGNQAAFDLLRLAVNSPRFDQEPVDRVRAQFLSGIIASQRDPNTIADHVWQSMIYGAHPYSRPGGGTKSSIAGITPGDLKAFHKANFARYGLQIGVVGDIDAKSLREKLDLLFGDLPQNQVLTPVADVAPKLDREVLYVADLPQTSLRLAFPGIAFSEPEYYPALLMNNILGGAPFTSHLWEEVRDKRGLSYDVDSDLKHNQHSNALVVTTSTRADRAVETLDVIRQTISELAEKGPTEAEVEASKKYLIGVYALKELDSSSSLAAALVEMQAEKLGIDYIQRRPALIEQVTLDQVKAVAKKLLSGHPAILAVGRPMKGLCR
ncbi:M16 family metallopeptidase [Mesorhizobium carmichaelinearum]|uniref:M16 family metallopeptidase n=1 Tax=Mesorhizobium carmichaelinearum TaxID=1208188 RepID=UPI001FCE56CA|nr:pitrilysin family protein [Mesorhizobium carmichaelinearum]